MAYKIRSLLMVFFKQPQYYLYSLPLSFSIPFICPAYFTPLCFTSFSLITLTFYLYYCFLILFSTSKVSLPTPLASTATTSYTLTLKM